MRTLDGIAGSVLGLWRYPVKSMLGEELTVCDVAQNGLLGDRGWALIDAADGKVVTAKNPRKWPHLFECRATMARTAAEGAAREVHIDLPDNTTVSSSQADIHRTLSMLLKREVNLSPVTAKAGEDRTPDVRKSEGIDAAEYQPHMSEVAYQDHLGDFILPTGTFFDAAPVHLLTTATLQRLKAFYPEGQFEVPRFRPNIVIETSVEDGDFLEDQWIGRTLVVGDTLRLGITMAAPRCVMTMLAQGDLPYDAGILRTAARHHSATVGVYASVLSSGEIRRGDVIRLEAKRV